MTARCGSAGPTARFPACEESVQAWRLRNIWLDDRIAVPFRPSLSPYLLPRLSLASFLPPRFNSLLWSRVVQRFDRRRDAAGAARHR